jgi:hypothetical protein
MMRAVPIPRRAIAFRFHAAHFLTEFLHILHDAFQLRANIRRTLRRGKIATIRPATRTTVSISIPMTSFGELLAHFASLVLQVVRQLIHAGGAQVMRRFHHVTEAFARIAGPAIAVLLRHVAMMMPMPIQWTRAVIRWAGFAAVGGRTIRLAVRGLGRDHHRAGDGGQHRKEITCFHTSDQKPENGFGCAKA